MIEENIPLEEDWGDLSDRDIYYAFEYFGGKTNAELQDEFRKNIHERCFNLGNMPIKPFLYYILGLAEYIVSNDFDEFNTPLAASGFVEILEKKVNEYPSQIKLIYPKLISLLKDIAENQLKYDIDVDIYGDLKKSFENINKAIEQC
ncbi:hypothetical protein [Marinibactrum halimedae]|uniref:Uncharacterized protein n=1 Tax=Marinibactrum halimedae TaxID=1444977 RepID=A0AA37WRF1_9GAMM|nr:hypothetical protein [Marinibactrum halimedae]MCD9461373.1 hypothetical protein [Marinibactrum halimedae]GLS28282.1 hypothetical protein GCM10007877_40010 [Marinibactrum halimedae]